MNKKFYFQILGYLRTLKTEVQNRALNQNFGPTTLFDLYRRVNTEKMITPAEKLTEKFYF